MQKVLLKDLRSLCAAQLAFAESEVPEWEDAVERNDMAVWKRVGGIVTDLTRIELERHRRDIPMLRDIAMIDAELAALDGASRTRRASRS